SSPFKEISKLVRQYNPYMSNKSDVKEFNRLYNTIKKDRLAIADLENFIKQAVYVQQQELVRRQQESLDKEQEFLSSKRGEDAKAEVEKMRETVKQAGVAIRKEINALRDPKSHVESSI